MEVTDFALNTHDGKTVVTAIHTRYDGKDSAVSLTENDYVFFTSGSMVQNTSYGTNSTAAIENRDTEHRGCFSIWEKLAARDSKLGHPEKFISDIDKTKWISFCLTVKDYPGLVKSIEEMIHDKDGCAGIFTFKDSSWLLSAISSSFSAYCA